MYIILWEYRVKADCLAEFETIYSADGAWAELFRKSRGYLGTELLRDSQHPQHFVTIDRWTSADAYEDFKTTWKDEYEMLDAQCNDLTEPESQIGTFLTLQPRG